MTKLAAWNRLKLGEVYFFAKVAMKFGILRRILITLALGIFLVLSSFASNEQKADIGLKQTFRQTMQTKFDEHIKNCERKLKGDQKTWASNSWVFDKEYKSSIGSILEEITNSMLDYSPHANSARYSDGRTIPEFYEEEGFNPIAQYRLEN